MDEKPTRMGLLITKKKLKLARKGHGLLKKKRDALILVFFETINQIKELRLIVAKKMMKAQQSLLFAQGQLGELAVLRNIESLTKKATFTTSQQSVMGVKILKLTDPKPSKEWFSATDSSAELDNAVVIYRKTFTDFMHLVEKQIILQRLAIEIQKTKRKVNSLENNIIPSLISQQKKIAIKLEENAREEFTRLKKVKQNSMGK